MKKKDISNTDCSVRQDSVLGHFSFLFHNNDLPYATHGCQIHLSAIDNSIFSSVEDNVF